MTIYQVFIKDLFLDVFWEIFYFPIWWYTRGLKKTAIFCWQRIKSGWRALALSIFLIKFFKPMYGQHGWDAYVLSLFARFWQMSWRFSLMIIWLAFWLFILFLWIILPIFIIGSWIL